LFLALELDWAQFSSRVSWLFSLSRLEQLHIPMDLNMHCEPKWVVTGFSNGLKGLWFNSKMAK